MAISSIGKSDNRRPDGNHCRGDHCELMTKTAVASTVVDAALLRQLIARGLQTRVQENRVITPDRQSGTNIRNSTDVVVPISTPRPSELICTTRDHTDMRTPSPINLVVTIRSALAGETSYRVALPAGDKLGARIVEDKVSVVDSLKVIDIPCHRVATAAGATIGVVGGGYLLYKIVRAVVVGAVATPFVGAASLALP